MIVLDPDLDPDPPPQGRSLVRGANRHVPRAASPDGLTGKIAAIATWDAARIPRVPSTRTLSRFLREAQAAIRLRGHVTVLLTTDAAIRELNRRFRGKNKATDVLSFPAAGPAAGPGPEKIAGDLAISVPTAYRQACEQGHSLAIEVKVLMLHGLLHLAGYDHEADMGQMARRERQLRARLRLPLGLIERVEAKTPVTSGPRAGARQ